MKKSSQGYRLVFGYLGVFLILIGVIVLMPLILLIFYPNESNYALNFIIPGVSSIFIGFLLSLLNYKRDLERLKRHDDIILLTLIWLSAIFISAIPFVLTKQYNLAQSVFEMTSGYTTTGMSIYQVEGGSHLYLFFRSLSHYIGGVGLVLVLTSAISDKFGMQLFVAEGHLDRLLPNLVKSARFILSIYSFYILIGSIFYMIFGMNVFNALNHAISAVSTGGFSTHLDSIAHYNNLGIEIVSIVLMLLGGTNFVIHLNLFRRKFKNAFNHIELKFLLIYGVLFIVTLTLFLNRNSINPSFRISSFLFVSTMTSTGFINDLRVFSLFPPQVITLLIIVMLIGGGQGSTAGGIKLYRASLFFKSLYWQIEDKFKLPNLIKKRHIYYLGKKEIIERNEINANYAFIGTYLLVLLIGVIIFTSFGNSLSDSTFEVSSLLGNIGLSIGIITRLNTPNALLWVSSVIMLLGRLEIYVVLFAIFRSIYNFKNQVVKN